MKHFGALTNSTLINRKMENAIEKSKEELENDFFREIETKLWQETPKFNFGGMKRREMVSAVVVTFLEHNIGVKYKLLKDGRVTASKEFDGITISVTLKDNIRLILMRYAMFMGVPENIADYHSFVENLFKQLKYSLKYLDENNNARV
jgi:hypothetical protein